MDLTKELPRLGKETKSGRVYYEVDGKSYPIGRRPDYADFNKNNGGYQDEETCVSVILGISNPNALLLSFVRWEYSPSCNGTENEPKRELYMQLKKLFKRIRKDIDIGIATGDIGKVSEIKEDDAQAMRELYSLVMSKESNVELAYKDLNCKFLNNRIFNSLGFLSWMQKNGYPIPEELAIEKNGHGETVWAGRSSKAQIATIPVPSGTKWFQIHFRIVNPTRIEIKTPDGMKHYHPDDLGFTTKTLNLFERFASGGSEYINSDKTDVSRLRTLLKKVFPAIKDDPIPYVKKKGYKAEFYISEAY